MSNPRPCRLLLTSVISGGILALAGCGNETTEPPQTACAEVGDICSVMGTGQRAYNGPDPEHPEYPEKGMPPQELALYFPIDLLFDSQDRLVVLDYNNQFIRRLDNDGLVRNIMGTGYEDYVESGSPALETSLHHAYSLDYDAAGNLYLAGNHVPQIIRLGTDDRAWIVAGKELPGFSGDGGNALDAEMDSPCGIAVASAGFPIFIADTYNHAVRVVDASGTIRTLAGNGDVGYTGDGGPSENAQLHFPFRVRYDEPNDVLYIADTYNHAVRRIDSSGIITTVAGTGAGGYGGDGGPGTIATLSAPLDARPGPDGALYIADAGNNRIRRLDPSGMITTVVGTGVEGDGGDGGAATDAELHYPAAVNFDSQGNLWISDTNNSRVRKVLLAQP